MTMKSYEGITDRKTQERWDDTSIERHDLYNFEAKMDYAFEETDKKTTKYSLDAYFFVPNALQIDKDSYPNQQFYSDMNNRVRFKTPQMSISGLLDNDNPRSPIYIVEDRLRLIEQGVFSRKIERKINREVRLLACIVKTTLRDQLQHFIREKTRLAEYNGIIRKVQDYVEDIESLRKRMISLGLQFMTVQIPEKLREAFNFADDYISLQIETNLTKILKKYKKHMDEKFVRKCLGLIEKEQDHRRSMQSQLLIQENNANESYTYWEGILKKYVQGVLYLDSKDKDPTTPLLQFFYSLAAGVAMFLSLFLGFYFLGQFEENTLPFIIGAIVIYMLKDRIKDIIKTASVKGVSVLFPDRRFEIIDAFNEEKIGECKETMHFLKYGEVPHQILTIRESSNKSIIESKGKPENVFVYKKRLTLDNETIEEIHTRHGDINDIIRFNVREFLRYADDPIQYENVWNRNKQEIQMMPVAKVYHINVIFRLKTYIGKQHCNTYYKKVRVVLDQRGIKRVSEPSYSLQ